MANSHIPFLSPLSNYLQNKVLFIFVTRSKQEIETNLVFHLTPTVKYVFWPQIFISLFICFYIYFPGSIKSYITFLPPVTGYVLLHATDRFALTRSSPLRCAEESLYCQKGRPQNSSELWVQLVSFTAALSSHLYQERILYWISLNSNTWTPICCCSHCNSSVLGL